MTPSHGVPTIRKFLLSYVTRRLALLFLFGARMPHRNSLLASLGILCIASVVSAQANRSARFLDECQRNGGDYGHACEARDFTFAAVKGLTIDGRENGGVTVHGWDQSTIKVVAMVQANAETD